MKNLSHVKLKIGYFYLFIGIAFCIFAILDVCSLMAWWARFFGYGALLMAAASHSFVQMKQSKQTVMDYRRSQEDLLKAKEAAESANKAKSLFLANMSHEIRTPMNSILGFTEILMAEPLTEGQRESVEILKLSAETLMSLIDEILDLSKIESDTIQLDETILDLRKLVVDAVELVRAQAVGKGVKLSCHLPPAIPLVVGDPLRLRQVLLNLLGNALKFTDKGEIVTRVRILEEKAADFLYLGFSVSDTGIGIPENKLDNIFEVFTQADPTISKRFGGTGLGLAICRRLIDLMDGEISVQSTPSQGTTFHFRIRLMKAEARTEVEPFRGEKKLAVQTDDSQKGPDTVCRSLLILLAEDDTASQKMTSLLMGKRMGHRVEIAENGAEAVQMALKTPYDIIFMDVNMPLMDGLEATRKIRDSGCRTPVLALTASAMKGDRERFLEVGMDGYLSKPINVNILEDVFRGYCQGGQKGPAHGAFAEVQEKSAPRFYETNEQRAEKMHLSQNDYEEILAEFTMLRNEDMQRLCNAFEVGDTNSVFQLAHKIKGSAKTLALEEIAALASDMEEAAREKDLPRAENHFPPLKAAFSKLLESL